MAVNVTLWPDVDGFSEELSVVVVVAAVISAGGPLSARADTGSVLAVPTVLLANVAEVKASAAASPLTRLSDNGTEAGVELSYPLLTGLALRVSVRAVMLAVVVVVVLKV